MSTPGEALDPVDRLAEEFLARRRRGEQPEIEEYAARHPELAEKIREVFAALLLIEDFGSFEEESLRRRRAGEDGGQGDLEELGDYRIVRKIGRGGMGVVYEAEQHSLGRRVALKILPFHSLLSPDHLRRFQLEARAAARLHHPNIVPVHDVGEASGVHYYAMQLIHGQGLDEVLEEVRRLRGIAGAGGVEEAAPSSPEESARRSATHRTAVGLLSGTIRAQDAPPISDEAPAPADADRATRSSSSARLPGQSDGAASADTHAGYCRSVAMVGLQVADALAHAHAAGVLHRDIKPSNLLLDLKGTVWVTDFGLAKTEGAEELTHSGDLVGTLRYMGPERFQGWSDPRSDVYSLGVTLYELLTLRPAFCARDRPTLVREVLHVSPPPPRRLDARIPRDLETVVLKAIEKEPAKRYASAAELAEDLRRFLDNRPIVARRTSPRERLALWFRRKPREASLVVAVGALLLLVAVIASVAAVHRGRLALNLVAEQAATLSNLRKALLEEARARRLSRRIGQRLQSLEAIARAAQIEPGVDLRGEAAAALALVDLRRLGDEWAFSDYRFSAFTLDPSFERYAYSDEGGAIRVCSVQDRSLLIELPGAGGGVFALRFSPDGRHLAADHGEDFTLWNLESRAPVTFRGGHFQAPRDFARDGSVVAVGGESGDVSVIAVASGELLRKLPCGFGPNRLSLHPDARLLALSHWHNKVIELWDLKTGMLVEKLMTDERPAGLAWHPSGAFLAAGGDSDRFRIYLWNTGSWERPRAVLEGHRAAVTDLKFSPTGDLLASYSFDRKTIIWDAWRGEVLLEYEGGLVGFSADGRQLGFVFDNTAEIFEVIRPAVYRRIHGRERAVELEAYVNFSPDSRWLASANNHGETRLWDVVSGDEVAFVGVPAASAIFSAGDKLLTSGARGLHLWPLCLSEDENGEALRICPPRAVLHKENLSIARLSPDGRTAVVLHAPTKSQTHLHLVSLEDPAEHRAYAVHSGLASLDVSPDGRWIAGGTWHWSGVALWERAKPEPVKILPVPDSAFVRFSPDGRWLVVADGPEFRFLKPGTWEVERVVSRRRVSDPPGVIDFTPDGSVAALLHTLDAVKLIDPATGDELTTLEAPHEATIVTLAFSRDGAMLAAGTKNGFIHLWDLRELRRELATLGLDWNLPPYPEPPRGRATKLRSTTVLLGELAPKAKSKASLQEVLERLARSLRETFAGERSGAGK
jgi:serine/threonine protein kinase/WD40 repeat protein